MALTVALVETKKNAAPGGELEVRYKFSVTGDTSGSDDEIAITDIANQGVLDVDPWEVKAWVENVDEATPEALGLGLPVLTFNHTDDDFDFAIKYDTAPTSGDVHYLYLHMRYLEATAQDGSSITATV